MKKTFLRTLIVLFCTSLIFISCDEEKSVLPQNSKKERLKTAVKTATRNASRTPSTSNENSDEAFINSIDCFNIVYPFTYIVDTVETTVNTEEEEIDFYDSLSETDSPELKFPVTIEYNDATQLVINNEEELNTEYDACFESSDCFSINYPVTFTDGTTETVLNSETELSQYLSALPETADANFVYPISITNANGVIETINNDDEFDAAYEACYDFNDCEIEDFSCFELDFPITAISSSGVDIVINNDEELEDYFIGLKETETPNFKFPLNINYEDGTQLAINTLEELENAFDDCFSSEDSNTICFDIKYSISVTKESDLSSDTTVVEIGNDDEFFNFIDQLTEDEFFNFNYPLKVILEDGSEKEITNDDEFIALVESCN